MRFSFEPQIVENQKEPKNAVCGTLVYEKKGKSEDLYPSEKREEHASKLDVKTGDYLKLSLSTSETRALFNALSKLYRLSGRHGRNPFLGHFICRGQQRKHGIAEST